MNASKLHLFIVAVDGTVASAIYGPLELVQACKALQEGMPELAPREIEMRILSPDGAEFSSWSGYSLPVDGGLEDLPPGSIVFVPGFGLPLADRIPELLERHAALGAWLRRQHSAGCTIVAWCTGSFLLAEHGLLCRNRATTYWLYADLFRERYPLVELDLDSPLVENERALCVGGAVCGQEAALTVIERYVGREFARLCAKLLVIENRPPSELRYEKRQRAMRNDPLIDRAVSFIRGNLGSRLTVDDVLRQVPASRRNLSRRFKLETGEGVQAFIQRLRIDRAKLLLETSSLPIAQIVDQVGYHDTSAFARRFKRQTSLTPHQYRQRYALSGSGREARA